MKDAYNPSQAPEQDDPIRPDCEGEAPKFHGKRKFHRPVKKPRRVK